MAYISAYFAPLIICVIVVVAMINTDDMFSQFVSGAKSGLHTVYSIAPSLIGLITAVEMMKASGAIDWLNFAVEPIADVFCLPSDIMPLVLLRSISGGGALAMLDRLLATTGPDSLSGRIASVLCASSETTLYTTTLYFSSVKIKRIRHTLVVALIVDFCCVLVSSITVNLFFG